MTLVTNSFGGVDLLATVKEFDKRIEALENPKAPEPPPLPAVSDDQKVLVPAES